MPRRCFALDLMDDAQLIADYERWHRTGSVPAGVIEDIRAAGVLAMEIWRTGDRLVMIAEVSDDWPRPRPPSIEVERWEALMWRFQRALPGAPDGTKWLEMARIFDLSAHEGDR